ncbi:hypothetical protein ES703_79331 [subsurface metagenome]
MNLKKATEILILWNKDRLRVASDDLIKATKLGVAASLEVQRLRLLGDVLVVGKLPSETED